MDRPPVWLCGPVCAGCLLPAPPPLGLPVQPPLTQQQAAPPTTAGGPSPYGVHPRAPPAGPSLRTSSNTRDDFSSQTLPPPDAKWGLGSGVGTTHSPGVLGGDNVQDLSNRGASDLGVSGVLGAPNWGIQAQELKGRNGTQGRHHPPLSIRRANGHSNTPIPHAIQWSPT